MAVADPRVMYRTAVNGGLADAFATMQNPFTGRRVVGILGVGPGLGRQFSQGTGDLFQGSGLFGSALGNRLAGTHRCRRKPRKRDAGLSRASGGATETVPVASLPEPANVASIRSSPSQPDAV